jgi:NCS1 family nucleobase:cation symporter-1
VSQQKTKNSLINWDLVTVNPNNKNWNWKDLFFFWGINIQSIIGFSLIASLYVVYSLNSFVVLFGTVLGALLVFLFSNLIGKPSQKFGLPFVVILRSSLGVRGAKFFGLFRGLVGIFMFGIQTYFLSKAIGYLIRIIFFSFDASFLDKEIFLIFLLSLNIIDWSSIIFAILVQVFLFSAGMNFNKKLIRFSAVTVYLGMLLFFFAVLLSDVKFSIKVFANIVDFSNFVELSNLMPVITVAGTMFAYFSIVILSFGDFSRYVKNETELKKGNLSLLLNLIIFSFLAVFIVAGVEGILSKNNTELEKILTNPMDIIGKLDNLLITNLVLIFVIIASLSTNLIANFIPSQYSLINFLPSTLTVKVQVF